MVRLFSLRDLKTVAKLYQEANPSCSFNDILTWTERGVKKFPQYNFVSIEKDEIVGAISGILESPTVAIINDIVVQSEHRNKHIGSTLLNHLLNIFADDEIKTIGLWVGWKNAAAIPFYYKHGFVFKKIGNIDSEDAIYLQKLLS